MKSIGTLALVGLALVLLASTATGAPSVSGNDVTLAPMALNSMSNPPIKIINAIVLDIMGRPVGAVRKVATDASGKPIKVAIELLGSHQIIEMDSSNLSYDEADNVVTASFDQSQIVQMAGME